MSPHPTPHPALTPHPTPPQHPTPEDPLGFSDKWLEQSAGFSAMTTRDGGLTMWQAERHSEASSPATKEVIGGGTQAGNDRETLNNKQGWRN